MRYKKTSAILLSLASFYAFLMLPLMPLWAQSFELPDMDLLAPVIKHTSASQTIEAGKPLTLKATVTDNVKVEEVHLFYRAEGAEKYSSIKMRSLGKGSYSAAIPQQGLKTPKIEYYIQASDKSGNKSLRGFSFEPLTMTVFIKKPPVTGKMVPPIVLSKDEAEAEIFTQKVVPDQKKPFALSTGEASLKKPWYKKWWVWTIALGVVGIAASGGGGGGGDPGAAAGTPPITPPITPPTTGSATISGPVP